ncbi:MAG: hypothetical protein H8F28_07575 [Fibrella sp.]|nr:hypothetical protein [Armatimonadota bacterium]
MVSAIDGYVQRPKRTYQADGLLDMACGFGILGIALSFYVGIVTSTRIAAAVDGGAYPPHAWQDTMPTTTFFMLLTNLMIPLSFHAVTFLKCRFVYPRLGYAQPRTTKDQRIQTVLFGIFALGIVAFFGSRPSLWQSFAFWTRDMTLLAVGIGFGIALVVNFVKYRFARHLIVAGISVAAAVLIAAVPLPWRYADLALALILGISLLVSGTIPFAQILRLPVLTEGD